MLFNVALLCLVLLTTTHAENLETEHAEDLQAGSEAHLRGDYTTAFRILLPLAERGVIQAQYNLGVMYEKGQGVPRSYAEAAKWYRKAAEQGDAEAQNNLGTMYANGKGVPKDYVQAYAWLNAAAEQGDDTAQDNRGIIVESMSLEDREQALNLARQYFRNYVLPFQQ